jgi:hypothetical protein
MTWELRSTIRGIRDEYRGWHNYKMATGAWPVWSVLTGVFSIPVLFASGTYCFIAALQTRRLSLIYAVLLTVVICGGIIWYALRRAACMADLSRAKRAGHGTASPARLESFLR